MPDLTFDAIGTQWRITTPAALAPDTVRRLWARIEAFDATYSRFRPDSAVTRLADAGGSVEFPADLIPLLDLYRTLYEQTDGRVTPLVGAALTHLGYDADYTLRPRAGTPVVPAWDETTLTLEGTVLTTRWPTMLDFGAAGKGYLIDILGQILIDDGVDDHLIDGSGDLLHRGPTPWRVALENPFDTTEAIGVATLTNGALCASATNRRRWAADLHHIIDPSTGAPVRDVVATWVTASSAMLADGLATALFFTEPAALATTFDFGYVRVRSDGSADYSADFEGELFR